MSGAGAYLKRMNPDMQVVAVEPASSPVLSEGRAGAHKIQGIGAGFVPDTLDTAVYDEVIAVADEDAFAVGRELAAKEVCSWASRQARPWPPPPNWRAARERGQDIVVILPTPANATSPPRCSASSSSEPNAKGPRHAQAAGPSL